MKPDPDSLQNLITQEAAKLASALALDGSTARIEVQCLLQHVLQVPRSYLLAHPERCLNTDEKNRYFELSQRRLGGEPVAYVLGAREFYGLNLKVTPATLIPRPDTELLVDLALQRIPENPSHPLPQAGEGERGVFHVLDMGTGSGAIALAIAHARPRAFVLGVDASAAALAVAQENAHALGLGNAHFVQSDWFAALAGQRFELVVSNPPYVAAADAHLARGDVRFEPASALASGADGLDDTRHIVSRAHAYLQSGGWLLLEHGYDQAAQVRALLRQAGFDAVFSDCDLAGIERVSGGKISS